MKNSINKFLVRLILAEREKRHRLKRRFLHTYYELMLRSRCKVGCNIKLSAEPYFPVLPKVMGYGKVEIGNNVTLSGEIEFICSNTYHENAFLSIGDYCTFGHGVSLRCCKRIDIGEKCLIGSYVRIADNNGHALDPKLRHVKASIPDNEIKEVVIKDNVWMGDFSQIIGGVTIGENAIVSAGSVVTSDVAPNSIVMGIPARKILWL
jgi:acetyltransferase-like isoleucine patch superfamily enzyme